MEQWGGAPRRGGWLLIVGGVATWLFATRWGGDVAGIAGSTFATLPVTLGRQASTVPAPATALAPLGEEVSAEGGAACGTLFLASAAAAMALIWQRRRDVSRVTMYRVAMRQQKMAGMKRYGFHRKWWDDEETADPTSLPLWKRDVAMGWTILHKAMMAYRKRGKKLYWDARVLKVKATGCEVELLKTGLLGWCPANLEGIEGRLEEGAIVKMECIQAPFRLATRVPRRKPWKVLLPPETKPRPIFSHLSYLQRQKDIAKAEELKAGEIVEGRVAKHVETGMLITLDGTRYGPTGFISQQDVSRKLVHYKKVQKLFPEGTPIKALVLHADPENGRITLSTKEFEDDNHIGWMASFPERCFMNAEKAVEEYYEKKEEWIQHLQR